MASALRMRTYHHITPAVAAMDSCFVLVRTLQHGIASTVSLKITDPAFYCGLVWQVVVVLRNFYWPVTSDLLLQRNCQ